MKRKSNRKTPSFRFHLHNTRNYNCLLLLIFSINYEDNFETNEVLFKKPIKLKDYAIGVVNNSIWKRNRYEIKKVIK